MTVFCDDQSLELSSRRLKLWTWRGNNDPESVVVLLHGLMMHGRAFNSFASWLAERGALVAAPDLRGFGRWHFAPQDDGDSGIDYKRSLEDTVELVRYFKERYPQTPLICAGESLGAHLARQAVALYPQLVDGLILSSPCIRPRMISLPLIPHAFSEMIKIGMGRKNEIDLAPFAKQFLEQEPENLKDFLGDPMTRKSLAVLELIDSVRIVGKVKSDSISPEVPVLVLRGRKDSICRVASTEKFIESLKSDNKTIHQCQGCGHVILQRSEVDIDIAEAVLSWLDSRCFSACQVE